jgi:DUF438 domain-containing protein
MKAMKPTPAYVPDGLVKPTYDDLKNHGTAENITKKLREQLPNEFEYHREVLLRARWRQQQCEVMAKDFREVVDNDEQSNKKLAQLERTLAEANADVTEALKQLHAVAAA